MDPLPFVYIAALPRTGSTLLSEALSRLPHAFILHEPHLGKNYFALHAADLDQLAGCNVDLAAFRRRHLAPAFLLRRLRWAGVRQDYFLRAFIREALPALGACARQVGVKEIKHLGWENYVRHFPDMKVVLLGRDPRDIYLSYIRLWRTGVVAWRGPFNPAALAAFIEREFTFQLALRAEADCLDVTYEAICTEPGALLRVKAFTRSPVPALGEVGAFVSRHPARLPEQDLHGGAVTDLRVNRWQREPDERLLAEANDFFERVPAYNAFWGYSAG